MILLLHGLPSRMYQPLLARLSDRYHLVEPDYPGFGHSAAPVPNAFGHTFDHLAEVITRFTEVLALSPLQPVHAGLRRSGGLPHGDGSSRPQSRIVQHAHDTGLGAA
ncbi:alpha/beta fold hydrolase [Mesorhizobium sp. BR115XR7A]|uniref:alpha/beta fold hydrolase n=1 Tax=Mesorhizobium sp. BR115XR7A TaxID=2876645 RepID=UPI001CCA7F08|nr:alpha/beta fold hydrolase [Mesorhizobium sp. BR115XR7A]MBZ9905507.1 alpha/beta fold hydrolase [Mesorhizobium sp. BR115XR7A]MBZ9931033.1 alpha/beta fold hydrolase [Mesorhizobium sp. BR1-1-5]